MDSKKWLTMLIGPWSSSKEGIEQRKQWQREKALLLRNRFGHGPRTRPSVEWHPSFKVEERKPIPWPKKKK